MVALIESYTPETKEHRTQNRVGSFFVERGTFAEESSSQVFDASGEKMALTTNERQAPPLAQKGDFASGVGEGYYTDSVLSETSEIDNLAVNAINNAFTGGFSKMYYNGKYYEGAELQKLLSVLNNEIGGAIYEYNGQYFLSTPVIGSSNTVSPAEVLLPGNFTDGGGNQIQVNVVAHWHIHPGGQPVSGPSDLSNFTKPVGDIGVAWYKSTDVYVGRGYNFVDRVSAGGRSMTGVTHAGQSSFTKFTDHLFHTKF